MSTTGAPQQHKQPSRKGRKAWRKNVDITDVQNGLEDLRDEIISGGPVAEKASEELFALDTAGSTEIKNKYNLQKPLKADEILAKRSVVPAIDSRKRTTSGLGDGIVEPAAKRLKKDWVPKKDIQRIKDGLQNGIQSSDILAEDGPAADFDLWTSNGPAQNTASGASEYVPPPRARVAPSTIRRAPLAMTESGVGIKAVAVPDAGRSYNPDFQQYDELMTNEEQKELAAEMARQDKAKAEAERRARIAAIAAEEAAGRTDDESAWEGFDTDNDDMLKQKRPQRKTPAQRNKVKKRKKAEQLAKHEQKLADKQKQAEQLVKALTQSDVELVLAQDDIAQDTAPSADNDEVKLRRRKLGNATIPDKPLEVVLPDELEDSLRRLRPEGNLLNDRYRNLLVNGKVESRRLILQPKKRKRTMTEKWSHKDFRVSV